MERATPPRRYLPSLADAVCVFAGLLGLVLLVATARHLWWSDSSVEVVPLAQVATSAVPTAARRVDPAIDRAHRAPRHDVAQRNVRWWLGTSRHDAPRHAIARAALRNGPPRATQRGVAAIRHEARTNRPHDHVVRVAFVTLHRAQPPAARTAALVPPMRMSRPSPRHSFVRAALHSPARSLSVAARAERRARARQAAIIEPPLGYQAHVTLAEVPAALGLALGRDPIPALQIRLKHRH